MIFVGYVAHHSNSLTSPINDGSGATVGIGRVQVNADNFGPFVGQPLCDATADVGTGPCYQSNLPVKFYERTSYVGQVSTCIVGLV